MRRNAKASPIPQTTTDYNRIFITHIYTRLKVIIKVIIYDITLLKLYCILLEEERKEERKERKKEKKEGKKERLRTKISLVYIYTHIYIYIYTHDLRL